jgi:hypothetical protein
MQIIDNGLQWNYPASLVAAHVLANGQAIDRAIEEGRTPPPGIKLTPKQIKRVRKYVRRNWLYTVESNARWYWMVPADTCR